MALNWVQTTAEGDKPLPLPQEKTLQSIQNCSLSLEFSSTKQKWTAKGTSFVTSQRIIFLRQPSIPSPIDPTTPSPHLRSLSVPLERLLEARYMIPIFGSPYYEARILPVRDGGLPQPTQQQSTNGNDAAGLGLLKIWFEEGGGIQFREAVEEVKARLDQQGGKLNHLEQLPSYELPPSPSNNSNESQPSTSTSTPTSNSASTSNPTLSRTLPQRSGTLPPDSQDLQVAQIALENEEREIRESLNQSLGAQLPPSHSNSQIFGENSQVIGVEGVGVGVGVGVGEVEGAPPGYEEACER